jgi:hypothetical protein
VYRLLPGNVDGALAAARTIRHPWYRCQGLALVATHIEDDRLRVSVVDAALRAADEMAEPNRVVTVASWPIEVLAVRGPRDRLRREVKRLQDVIAAEPHSLRRADALSSLLQRAWPDPECRASLLGSFRAACADGHGWRRDRLLRHMAQRLAESDVAGAEGMVAMIEEDRIRRRAEREVAAVATTRART